MNKFIKLTLLTSNPIFLKKDQITSVEKSSIVESKLGNLEIVDATAITIANQQRSVFVKESLASIVRVLEDTL